jgi:hypothetical protein
LSPLNLIISTLQQGVNLLYNALEKRATGVYIFLPICWTLSRQEGKIRGRRGNKDRDLKEQVME